MKKSYSLGILLLIAICTYILAFHKQNRTLLITGCARSGTTYISKALLDSGLEIGHERMLKDGVSSWPLAAAPEGTKRRVNLKKFRFEHVFHQVRDPLKVISSVYRTENRHSWNYILKYTPEIRVQDSHLVKCAKYWYYWNLKAEKMAEWTYSVENIDALWDEFERRLGKKLDRSKLHKVPKTTNTAGEHAMFTWKDLERELDPELLQKIQSMAIKYGYPIHDLE